MGDTTIRSMVWARGRFLRRCWERVWHCWLKPRSVSYEIVGSVLLDYLKKNAKNIVLSLVNFEQTP